MDPASTSGRAGAVAVGRRRGRAAAPLPGAVRPDGHGLRAVAAGQAAKPAAVVGAVPADLPGGADRGGEPDGTGREPGGGPAAVAGVRAERPGHDPAVHVLAARPG